MTTVQQVCQAMESLAPLKLAEEWDNVGLLVGDRSREVNRVMTCLTITPASCDEAIRENADMIVTHHPLPFRPLKKITADNVAGKMLLALIRADVAIYSSHTAFDSAGDGINQQIASGLGLTQIAPLICHEEAEAGNDSVVGTGRVGTFESKIGASEFCEQVKSFFGLPALRIVGASFDADERPIGKVAIACGSAGQFLSEAARQNCDAFITGETNFHGCLEAEARGILLALPGHFATERFAMNSLAEQLQKEFSDLQIRASDEESDPISVV